MHSSDNTNSDAIPKRSAIPYIRYITQAGEQYRAQTDGRLGVKDPRRIEKQRAYGKAMREQERKSVVRRAMPGRKQYIQPRQENAVAHELIAA